MVKSNHELPGHRVCQFDPVRAVACAVRDFEGLTLAQWKRQSGSKRVLLSGAGGTAVHVTGAPWYTIAVTKNHITARWCG